MIANWIIIGFVVILSLFVVYFLIKRNYKDGKNYKKFLDTNDEIFSKDDFEKEEL
jgi:uncharacterized membrane protein